ncbi:DsrE/DsrF/TusD sulfur relay family protein [Pseudomonas sp. NPDC089569]|uniref:DsrE/DsrF/TusD sulfur relay family protein n=1 Tax=Pseudomonas sp. NPDC089569 TaxID=3390722 RepID=UPI003D05C261
MGAFLFIINDGCYGSERAFNALRLAGSLSAQKHAQVRVFLQSDAVGCARAGQRVPTGHYNLELVLAKVLRKGEVALCGDGMDARGMKDAELVDGVRRAAPGELADWTMQADKVLIF